MPAGGFKTADLPKELKPFHVHGAYIVKYDTSPESESGFAGGTDPQAIALCPFTQKSGKFYINMKTQQWDSKTSGKSGNFNSFLFQIAQHRRHAMFQTGMAPGQGATMGKGSAKLAQHVYDAAANRGLDPFTLEAWGVGYDPSQKVYTVPIPSLGNADKAAVDVRFWKVGQQLRSTPGAKPGLFGGDRIREKGLVVICEGEWDVMAFYEMAQHVPELKDVTIVSSSAGAGTMRPEWCELFSGRQVLLIYDADEAGMQGEAKAWAMLNNVGVATVQCVHWPENSPQGFDFRDYWTKLHAPGSAVNLDEAADKGAGYDAEAYRALTAWKELQEFLQDRPRDMERAKKVSGVLSPEDDRARLKGKPGLDFDDAVMRMRKLMHLPNPDVLALIYATMLANREEVHGDGDPLWMFLVAPPSGGKSMALLTMEDAPLVHFMSNLTSHTLISGMHGQNGRDPSLLPKLRNKTVVIKDFTSILTSPATVREEILGQLRDAYDGRAEKDFGNGLRRTYNNLYFGVISGVTPAIYQYNAEHTMLGERFLYYKNDAAGLSRQQGHDIAMKAVSNLLDSIHKRVDVDEKNSKKSRMKEISNGVLEREIGDDDMMDFSEADMNRVVELASWIANARAGVAHERYTRDVLAMPFRENPARLARQLTKLAVGLCLVYKQRQPDPRVWRILAQVSRSTVPDRVEAIVRAFMIAQNVPMTTAKIAESTGLPSATLLTVIEDMILQRQVKVAAAAKGGIGKQYQLTPSLFQTTKTAGIFDRETVWKTGGNGVTIKKLPPKRVDGRV